MSGLANFQLEDPDGDVKEYTAETLVDAHRGEYGAEGEIWAAEAIEALETTDYFDGDGEEDYDQEFEELEAEEQEGGDGLAPWEHEFVTEVGVKARRLEQQIGRPITQAETQAIMNDVLPQGHVPDLVETYGPKLAARETDSEHTRRDLMTEEVEDRMEEDPTFGKEPREPGNEDEARRAYMTEQLEDAQAEEPVSA